MARHDDLLDEGAREAPEPETAEQRSGRLGMKSAAGGVVGGGVVLAKIGVLGKLFFWIFAWNGINNLWRLGGWIAIAVVAAAVVVYLVLRSRREHS
jgi:hypothetical protein